MLDRAIGVLLSIERRSKALASRPWLLIATLTCVSLAARALLLPLVPVPRPAIQDEFSYLLAADTFASGRLANPTPPLIEHFETPQVIARPTYASKYPPFSALLMALGQRLTGIPWTGVWLSTGLLAGALCWALLGWLPASWALAGSLIALLKIGIVSYWSESYWGGNCAAIGGALVVGALPRLSRRPETSSGVAFAVGLAILANTRPYEGLVLAAACITQLAIQFAKSRTPLAPLVRGLILPAFLVLVPAFAWMGYYNYRVTGNALELPYTLHEKQYVARPPLWWQDDPRQTPEYSSAALRNFWTQGDAPQKLAAREHFVGAHISDLRVVGLFFLGWPLLLGVAALTRQLWRDPAAKTALVLLCVFYAGIALDLRLFPHYAAPATALVYILAACAFRALRQSWPGADLERAAVTWGFATVFALTAMLGLLTPDNRNLFGSIDYHVRAEQATASAQLAHQPGRQLVLVRYGPHHDLYEELVYNGANLDNAKLIWARSLGPQQDRQLAERFPGRTIWLAEEDGRLTLTRYKSNGRDAD
jgi:hypothetical protein